MMQASGWRGLVLAGVVMVLVTRNMVQGNLDVKAWLGKDPLTPKKIVNDLVEYFSERDPHGIPVLQVPELIEIPGELAASQITFYDPTISGHSRIRLEYVNVNLTSLSGTGKISLPWVNIRGDYLWPGLLSNSRGRANITMVGIEAGLDTYFGVNDQGRLIVDDVQMNLVYDELLLDFTTLTYTQELVVGAAHTFFSTFIQPFLFGRVHTRVQTVLNERLEQQLANVSFPDSISAVDYGLAKFMMDLRKKNMDPLKIPNQDVHLTWGVTVQLQNIEVSGLTTLHRTHEVSAQFIDNAVYITVQIGTRALQGSADWSLSAALLPAVGGHLGLELESLEVTVEAQQPADIRSPPTLRKIDVKLGNLAVRSAGEGTLDYLTEAVVNILPNALRNHIMDKMGPKIHQMIQKRLNRLDIYGAVMAKLTEREAQAA